MGVCETLCSQQDYLGSQGQGHTEGPESAWPKNYKFQIQAPYVDHKLEARLKVCRHRQTGLIQYAASIIWCGFTKCSVFWVSWNKIVNIKVIKLRFFSQNLSFSCTDTVSFQYFCETTVTCDYSNHGPLCCNLFLAITGNFSTWNEGRESIFFCNKNITAQTGARTHTLLI